MLSILLNPFFGAPTSQERQDPSGLTLAGTPQTVNDLKSPLPHPMTPALVRKEFRRRGRQFVRSRNPESSAAMIELVVDLVKVKNVRSMENCLTKTRGLDRVLPSVRDQTPAHEYEVRDSVQILENAQLVQNQHRRSRSLFSTCPNFHFIFMTKGKYT